MDIYINGNRLDLYGQDASIHSSNFRFSDVLADDYSNDISIPRSAYNDSILDLYGMLDRGQLFGSRILCCVRVGDVSSDGYLRVTEIDDEEVTATVFLSRLPASTFDKTLREVRPDDDSSIFPWNEHTPVRNSFTEFGFPYYDCGIGPTPTLAMHHPTVRISSLIGDIATRIGTEITAPTTSAGMIAANKKVCPQNKTQILKVSIFNGVGTVVDGGQHVANNYDSEGDDELRVVFNRDVTLSMAVTAALNGIRTTTTVPRVSVSINGSTMLNVMLPNYGTYSNIATRHIEAGDVVTFSCNTTDSIEALVLFSIMNYDIKDEDYDIDLVYNHRIPSINTIDAGGSHHVFTDEEHFPAYSFIGTICNLPDVTIKQLLSSVAWYTGTTIRRVGNSIAFAELTTAKSIGAKIESMSPVSDRFGKKTVVAWGGGIPSSTITINNDNLEEEKVLHESIFEEMKIGINAARIEQYAWSVEEGTATCKFVYEGDGAPIGIITPGQTINNVTMGVPGQISTLGLDALTKIVEVTGSTYDDIIGEDFVVIDGHKFVIIESDRDVETKHTTFKALEI